MGFGGFRFYTPEDKAILTYWRKTTTTDVVARGDILKTATDDLVRMETTTDNLSFAGIAVGSSPTGDNELFAVMEPSPHNCGIQFVMDLDTATAVLRNAQLQFASSGNGTSFQQLNPSDTDPIMRAAKSNSGSSAKQATVYMLLPDTYLADAS